MSDWGDSDDEYESDKTRLIKNIKLFETIKESETNRLDKCLSKNDGIFDLDYDEVLYLSTNYHLCSTYENEINCDKNEFVETKIIKEIVGRIAHEVFILKLYDKKYISKNKWLIKYRDYGHHKFLIKLMECALIRNSYKQNIYVKDKKNEDNSFSINLRQAYIEYEAKTAEDTLYSNIYSIMRDMIQHFKKRKYTQVVFSENIKWHETRFFKKFSKRCFGSAKENETDKCCQFFMMLNLLQAKSSQAKPSQAKPSQKKEQENKKKKKKKEYPTPAVTTADNQ